MPARGLAVMLLAGLVAAGCTTPPPQPESMRDPDADFSAYATFGWATDAGPDGTDLPMRLLDQNIRAAVTGEMQRRGYKQVDSDPALRMTWSTTSAEKIESNPVRVGIGMGSWGGNVGTSVSMGSPSVRSYQEGVLVIHAIDTARNAEVWQGRIAGRLNKGSLEPAAVTTAVQMAMKDFPARSAAPQDRN